MNSKKRFWCVYAIVEGLYGRKPAELEMERAYKRLLHVMDWEPLP